MEGKSHLWCKKELKISDASSQVGGRLITKIKEYL